MRVVGLAALVLASLALAPDRSAARRACAAEARFEERVRIPGAGDSAAFEIDRYEVTVARFARFVAATGYKTEAEREPGRAAVFTGFDLEAGGWWRASPQASWRNPDADGRRPKAGEPVVQITLADAQAFARWAGGRLPSEAEWERAAMAGAPEDERQPREANTWQGVFPLRNTGEDGYVARAPVGCYAANPAGVHDMVGNVWEMTAAEEGGTVAIRGGSYLCAPNFCRRYRPSGRELADGGIGTSHIGFRLIYPANHQP